MLRLGRLAVVLDIMPLRPGEEHGSTASLLNHGCMIPLLAIKFSARGAPCPDFLVSSRPIRLDRVGRPHRDVDAGQSRCSGVVVVVVESHAGGGCLLEGYMRSAMGVQASLSMLDYDEPCC